MSKQFAGIDIGSRSIELVLVDEHGEIIGMHQSDTTSDPMCQAQKLLYDISYERIMATGYGRNLFEISFDAVTITEIKAYGRGAREYYPDLRTVLDIGGQDSKAISLNENGRVTKFEMNDRCAAGTGKFLEIMARTLGYSTEEFGSEALQAEKEISISSMCTVFAESEVTSLIARGKDSREIAFGLHNSVVRRVSGMLNRVSDSGDIVFSGGVANNQCIASLLGENLNRTIHIPENPQFTGAVGAALLALEGYHN